MTVRSIACAGVLFSIVATTMAGDSVALFDRTPVQAKCTCHRDDGDYRYHDTSCWWLVEESVSDDGTILHDAEDTCPAGLRFASYFLSTRFAQLFPSDAWAYVDCLFDPEAAVAAAETSSWLSVRMTLQDPCPGCVGHVKGEFKPGIQLCAHAYDERSHAMIAAAMACESSVADTQNGSTEIFPLLKAEASATSGVWPDPTNIELSLPGIPGGNVTINFSPPRSAEKLEVGSIAVPRRVRHYKVDRTTLWQIEFSFSSAIGVSVSAEDMAFETSAAIARSGRGTWDTSIQFECEGGCWTKDQCATKFTLDWGIPPTKPDCSPPR